MRIKFLFLIIVGLIIRLVTFSTFNFKLLSDESILIANINPHFLLILSILLSLYNLVLIKKICNNYFGDKVGFWTMCLYFLSPWVIFSELTVSIYLLTTSIMLLIIFLSTKQQSLSKNINTKSFFMVILIVIFLLFANILIKNISDLRIVNPVNQLQGELLNSGIPSVFKLVVNKYSYAFIDIIFNVLKVFSPVYYFTSQAKILSFFSPPILIVFFVPFLIGIFELMKKVNIKFGVLLIFLFVLMTLSYLTPSLIKLFPLSIVFYLSIALGLERIKQRFKNQLLKYLFMFLVVLNYLVWISDVVLREVNRM